MKKVDRDATLLYRSYATFVQEYVPQWVKTRIHVVVFDWDGVFTNNTELIGMSGGIGKFRSHYDGQGVSLLRAAGIEVAIATNEKDENAAAAKFLVDKWNNLPSAKRPIEEGGWAEVKLFTGVGHVAKEQAVKKWLDESGHVYNECVAMGDDLVDLPLLNEASVAVVPISASRAAKKVANFITKNPAGNGAVRDFVDFYYKVCGLDQTKVSPF